MMWNFFSLDIVCSTTTLSFDGTKFTEYFNDGMQLIYQAQITGGAVFASTPVWVPYAQQRSQAPGFCDPAYSFTGGPVSMVQYPAGSFDGDYAC